MTTKELRRLFKNNSNCYAETTDDSVVMAVDEDRFIKIVEPLISKSTQPAMALPEKIFEKLVELYPDNYVCVALICDEVLDRSGALLGKVRSAVKPGESNYRDSNLNDDIDLAARC